MTQEEHNSILDRLDKQERINEAFRKVINDQAKRIQELENKNQKYGPVDFGGMFGGKK